MNLHRIVKLLPLLSMLSICQPSSAETTPSLREIMRVGALKAEFRASGLTAENISNYYGASMNVNWINLSDTVLRFHLEPGLYLRPDNDALQRMILVEDRTIVLGPNSQKKETLIVFCTEKYDQSPNKEDRFTLSEAAPIPIAEAAHLLGKNQWHGHTAQSVVWAMHHHDLPLSFIHGEDEAKVSRLRFLVKSYRDRLGLPIIPTRQARSLAERVNVGEVPENDREYTLRKWKVSISGQFRYHLDSAVTASMQVFDEAGELRFTYFENKAINQGNRVFNFTFNSFTYNETEQFYLRLIHADGTILKERRISLENF